MAVRLPLRASLAAALAWLLSRSALLVVAPDVARITEVGSYVGAAASHLRSAPLAWPPWAWMNSPQEFGSLLAVGLTALCQAALGETALALAAPSLLLGALACGLAVEFAQRVAGRSAGWAALWLLLPPANVLAADLQGGGSLAASVGGSWLALLGLLALVQRPQGGRAGAVGVLIGLVGGAYPAALPWLAAGGIAWALSPAGVGAASGPGAPTAAPRWTKAGHGGLLLLGALVGAAPPWMARMALGAGWWGPAGARSAASATPPWHAPSAIWLQPLDGHGWRRGEPVPAWMDGPLLLGLGLALLGLLWLQRRHLLAIARSPLAGLGSARTAQAPATPAAFGAPALLLCLVLSALRGPSGAPAQADLYPVFAVAIALLMGHARGTWRAAWTLAIPLLLAHGAGAWLLASVGGPAAALQARGFDDGAFARRFVFNQLPWVPGPQAALETLQRLPPQRRGELVAALGQSMRGQEVSGLAEDLQGWERATWFRGLVLGRTRPLVPTPGAHLDWPKQHLEPAPPALDTCAEIGRAIGAGVAGRHAEARPPDPELWRAFGQGLGRGAALDAAAARRRWAGEPAVPPDLLAAAPSGDQARPWWRGLGYALGIGGSLMQHEELGDVLDATTLGWVFEGVGFARGERDARRLRAVGRVFGAEAAAAWQRGVEFGRVAPGSCEPFPDGAP